MDWSDVGNKIISVGAPLLGGALGGPAGVAIGQIVASQFGLTEASPDKVLEAITADPEARLKLTELEFRHSERLIELENEYFKLQSAPLDAISNHHGNVCHVRGYHWRSIHLGHSRREQRHCGLHGRASVRDIDFVCDILGWLN